MASESETVRAEFERWLLEESIGDATARHPKGLYVLPEVEDQWFVWRAAWQAASSSTPSAEAQDAARLVWVGKNWTDEHSLRYASHVLSVGGVGDIGDIRAYVDAAIKLQESKSVLP